MAASTSCANLEHQEFRDKILTIRSFPTVILPSLRLDSVNCDLEAWRANGKSFKWTAQSHAGSPSSSSMKDTAGLGLMGPFAFDSFIPFLSTNYPCQRVHEDDRSSQLLCVAVLIP